MARRFEEGGSQTTDLAGHPRRSRSRHSRSRHRHSRGIPWEGASEAHGERSGAPAHRERRPPTPEERLYREARQAANRKMAFLGHAVPYAVVCSFLLLVAGFRAAFVVAVCWGVGLAIHYFFAIVAPGLRQRLVEQEVQERVRADLSKERRDLETRHSQRVEKLSASIAHEIRNPITAARSLVQQMGEDPSASENVQYAQVALEELQRVERSVSHLLRFAREEDLELTDLDVADVVESALETFRDRLAALSVQLDQDLRAAGTLRGDPEKLRRVVINLLGNALDAFAEARTPAPRIRIQAGENLAATEIWLRIQDNGPGMDPERLQRIFDPFYTSKSSGTGLGLALTRKVVDAHGGSIEAHSSPGKGTEFLLTLPKQGTHEEPAP